MSREELREQLARLADSAPVASVPADTYRRGRRATTRARLGAGVVAAACLVLATALGTQLLGYSPHATEVGASPMSPAIPDHIWAAPSGFDNSVSGGWLHHDDLSDDLRTGIAAAAYTTPRGTPVVVDAASGRYHLLDLPDNVAGLDGPARWSVLSLSPDGSHLAWAWVRDTGTPALHPSGVAVLDLVTGEYRFAPLTTDHTMLVTSLAWSSNSRWLGWQGFPVRRWTGSDYQPARTYFGGSVDVAAAWTRAQKVPLPGEAAEAVDHTYDSGRPRPIAVSDSGRLALVTGETLWLDGRRTTIDMPNSWFVRGLWFRGRTAIALESAPGGRSLSTWTAAGGAQAGIPTSGFVGTPRLIGTKGSGLLLQRDDGPEDDQDPTTVILGRRTLIQVDAGVANLSLATDLLGPHGETARRPEPTWPMPAIRKWRIGAEAAALVLLAGGVALRWRRGRRRLG